MLLFAQADATALPLADDSVDLVFTSPPYIDARSYGINAQRNCRQWIRWMLAVVTECTRVSRGLVLINCAAVTRNWQYQPGPEGLLYRWWRSGGNCWRPAYWHRVGIPGSGGRQWLRADVEYVLAFTKIRGPIPWADNTANGHRPKWGPGGEMSNRAADGRRVNQWGASATSTKTRRKNGNRQNAGRPSHQFLFGNPSTTCGRRQNGNRKPAYFNRPNGYADGDLQKYRLSVMPVLANPGNVIKTVVGGNQMGNPLCHENEAPFPEALAEWFIRSHCPPGGIVLDPFSGSGTTCAAAAKLGRRAIGLDLRASQCHLGRRRCFGDLFAMSYPAHTY